VENSIKSCVSYLKSAKSLSTNTLISYERDLRQYAAFLAEQGVRETCQAGEQMISRYIDRLVALGKAPSTISRCVASFRAYYRYLIMQGMIEGNPIAGLEAPKVEKKPPSILTNQEVQLLIQQPGETGPKSIRDRAIIKLLYRTGIKVTELVSLNMDDVSEDCDTITCREGRKSREVPIIKSCMLCLQDYLRQSRPYLLREPDEKAFFINSNGKRLSRQGIWKILKKYSQEACPGRNITPYTLRHTLAADLIKSGTDLEAVQTALGNSTKSTLNKYSRCSGADNKL